MYEFRYRRAGSVDEAAALLTADADAMILAGGQTLLPTLKLRMGQPTQLIDIARVSALRGIRLDDGTLTIGATTSHAAVAESADVRRAVPALAHLAAGIGDPLVRNRGTIGGSLAYNHPGADYPAAVLGLDATITTNRRQIRSDEFLQGMLDTALQPGEIIVAISFPIPRRAGYLKFRSPGSGYVLTGAFVAETAGGVRVAINGAAPCAFRHADFEQALTANFSTAALDGIGVPEDELLEDLHAAPDYRARLACVAVSRAVDQARGHGPGAE